MLLDWEDAFADAAPLYDLFHFLVQSSEHLRHPDTDSLLRALRSGQGWEGWSGWIGAAVDAYLEGAGLGRPSISERFEEYLASSQERLLQ